MTRAYVSSTFSDLKDFREAVTRALRKSGIQVIAMEDYVASDSRPLDRCLQDVRDSDIYIGLFAHRYGFVPTENNLERRSITELEYRQAQQSKKACLIFLLDESAPWIPKFMDSNTGDGDGGRKIRELRAELGNERLASFFRGPDDLAALATAAVARHEAEQRQALVAPTLAAPQVEAPQARELHSHLFLTYLEPDAPAAQAISTQLKFRNRSVLSLVSAMLAVSSVEFASLENSVRQCHAAAVVLSAETIARMQEQGSRSIQLLSVLKERTGCLIALCRDAEAMERAPNWGATHIINIQEWQPGTDLPVKLLDEIDRILASQLNKATGHVVGLPFVIIAMQQQEASDLVSNPAMITDQASNRALRQLLELRSENTTQTPSVSDQLSLVAQVVGRYGNRRQEWRPFGGNGPSIGELVGEIVDSLNTSHNPRLKGRFIKVQHYSFDPIMDRDNPFHSIYRELVQGGCILIVDELSLLHPGISEALLRFPFFATEQVSVVSVSPLNPYGSGLFAQLESRVSERLALAHYRFERDYDPKCELSVGDDRRLKRWLYTSLPTVLQDLREPVPDSSKLRIFAQELGREIDHRMASEYYTKGAGL